MRSWRAILGAASLLVAPACTTDAGPGTPDSGRVPDAGPPLGIDAGMPDAYFAGWDVALPDVYVQIPDAHIELPDVNIQVPDVYIERPDVYVELPDVYVPPGVDGGAPPDVYVVRPDAYIEIPDAHVVFPDVYVQIPDAYLNIPDVYIPDVYIPRIDAAIPPPPDAGVVGPPPLDPPPDAPLRRLTGEQYDNSVLSLLRINAFSQIMVENPSRSLPADESAGPFDANYRSPVTLTHVDQYGLVADAIADAAIRTLMVRNLARCDLPGANCCAAEDDACATAFITNFGLRAYRRPLTAAEISDFMTVYTAGRAGATGSTAFRNGIELVLSAFLQMPSFVYIVENDGALNDYQIATRLSYFLWNTTPDDTLLTAAQMGQLRTVAQIGAQFDRMWMDAARTERQLADFHTQWLALRDGLQGLDKSPTRYPMFLPAPTGVGAPLVRSRLQRSFERHVNYVIRSGDSRYISLMSSPIAFLGNAMGETGTDPVAQIYNVTPPAGHQFPNPIGVNPAQRRGILTHPAYLAVHGREILPYPVGRGLNVIRNVLCLNLPPPPPGVDTTIPPFMPGMTRRQVMETYHEAQPLCAGCHTVIDPIGFTFDLYGALGEYRTYDYDDAAPVDATGTMNFARILELYVEEGITEPGIDITNIAAQLDGPVTGAIDLINDIASSRVGHDCYALQWYRLATQRREQIEDQDTIFNIQYQFAASGGDIRQLLRTLATSDMFRNR